MDIVPAVEGNRWGLLLSLQIPAGKEIEMVTMVLECCSQEKTYIRYAAGFGTRVPEPHAQPMVM